LAVVKRETAFVPPSIEALIRTKTIVGITNEVDILGDHRTIDAHVARFPALFTRYSRIDHFEMIDARVLKLLHKKINELLKPRDLVPESIGFAERDKLGEKCIGALLPGLRCLLIGIEPLFCLS
jgi:hypothetical protein